LNLSDCGANNNANSLEILNDVSLYQQTKKLDYTLLDAYMNSPLQNDIILVADNYQIADYNQRNPNKPLNVLNIPITSFRELFFNFPGLILFLIPSIEDSAKLFAENGITDKIIVKWIHLDAMNFRVEAEQPKVLTLFHLKIGFKIHYAFLSVALFVFFIELLILECKILLTKLAVAAFFKIVFDH